MPINACSPTVTRPAMAARGATWTNSPIEHSWSTVAPVFTIAPEATVASAFTTAPGITSAPGPTRADGDTAALGLTAVTSSPPAASTAIEARDRAALSPTATNHWVYPPATSVARSRSVPSMGTPSAPRSADVVPSDDTHPATSIPASRSTSMHTSAWPPAPTTTTPGLGSTRADGSAPRPFRSALGVDGSASSPSVPSTITIPPTITTAHERPHLVGDRRPSGAPDQRTRRDDCPGGRGSTPDSAARSH